jgi:hypothetical protein
VTTRRDQAATRAHRGSYDPAAWRQGRRSQQEKGVHVYIPAEVLREIGVNPDGPAPRYRVRPGSKGRAVFVNLAP